MNTKKRNKALLERLAEHNRRRTPPQGILSELGVDHSDMELLNALGGRAEGYHALGPHTPGNPAKLASLGLVFIRKEEISLADAGRFLLVLAPLTMRDTHENF